MTRRRQRPRGRNINGVLLLDKPTGITSNEALQHVKHLFKAKKAGHTGSLDKMASGLLPLCFGEATKFSGYLLDADKRYLATCRLGIETTTGDAAGDVVSEGPIPQLTEKSLDKVLDGFRGEIEQVPPMFSALKHQGKRLYELAYQGIEVERKPRSVRIYHLALLELGADRFEIEVACSKGTYIRTLAEDIGRVLGCGAHVCALRRTGAGPFSSEEMVTMEEIESLASGDFADLDKKLIPVDEILRSLPSVTLAESLVHYLGEGHPVVVPRAPTSGLLRMYDEHQHFLGIGEIIDDGRVAPRRLVRG